MTRDSLARNDMGVERETTLTKTLAVTSGKGGVGKTIVVANLSVALSRLGRKVVILDADFGLANIDIVFGVPIDENIAHVLTRGRSFEEIIVEGPEAVRIVPASSGLQDITRLDEKHEEVLVNGLGEICRESDVVLLDTAAGIADNVMKVLSLSDQIILVTDNQPTSLVDAYALIKVVSEKDSDKRIRVIINSCASKREAEGVYTRLEGAVANFLKRKIEFLGYVIHDVYLAKSVTAQQPVVIKYPFAPSSRCFEKIAERLVSKEEATEGRMNRKKLRSFLEGIGAKFIAG